MHVQYTVRTHEVQTLQKSEHAVNHYTFKLLLEHISANTAVCETKLPKQAIKVNIVQTKNNFQYLSPKYTQKVVLSKDK